MPVHVYGNPCDTEKIKKIADTYGLKVIYEAAHALSGSEWKIYPQRRRYVHAEFHATKTYNTMKVEL
jgi:dTDP-4-amino-4,6-dideoxygalactose transaminase